MKCDCKCAKWGAATADRLVVYNQYNNKQQTIVHRRTTITMLAKRITMEGICLVNVLIYCNTTYLQGEMN